MKKSTTVAAAAATAVPQLVQPGGASDRPGAPLAAPLAGPAAAAATAVVVYS